MRYGGYRAVVLVEGISDQLALQALAERRGRELEGEGVAIVAMGGATNVGRFLERFAARGLEVAGLCDVGEERYFRRALERAGFGSNLAREDMEASGFYVCEADLEDELIRSLGVDAVLEVAAAQGELRAFRALQRQPAWRQQGVHAQLRRWLAASARRKCRYAPLLVRAMDPTRPWCAARSSRREDRRHRQPEGDGASGPPPGLESGREWPCGAS